ncbi:hypothetical protein ACSXCN_06755 [Clostridium perfringens]
MELNNIKVDWTDFKVLTLEDKRDVFFKSEKFGIGHTEILAEEYFDWAKQCISNKKDLTTRECVEIITNIKRCVDCKCETFLKNYGFLKEINLKNYSYLNKLGLKGGITIISLTSYLLDLNLIIVEEIRKLRNETEHDYTRPSFKDAERAVAIGELFLLAVEHKINCIRYYCELHSKKNEEAVRINLYKDGEDRFFSNSYIAINNNINLESSSIEYAKILKILINGNFIDIVELFNRNVPINQIKYKEYFDENAMELDELESYDKL